MNFSTLIKLSKVYKGYRNPENISPKAKMANKSKQVTMIPDSKVERRVIFIIFSDRLVDGQNIANTMVSPKD
ncbi:hypothetical protein D1872_246030 [compost metagenome]